MVHKTKNQLRRERAKQRKGLPGTVQRQLPEMKTDVDEVEAPDSPVDVVVEDAPVDGFADYQAIFDKFNKPKESPTADGHDNEQKTEETKSEYEGFEKDDLPEQLSKRQFKRKYQIPLAYLKAESDKPELLEMADVNSPDPRLLVYLKTLHNAIPVPQHWGAAKGFLMGRRNYDRPPYQLPKFIADTGIIQMRSSMNDKETTLKQRMRERVQPRMGQLDIDFNKLYDAFFKNQTKPDLLRYGEVYFEGLESIELLGPFKVSKYRPGVMSAWLREALGMIGPKSRLPPWYEKFQKLGPPPAYPYMRINSDGTVSFDNDQRTVVNRAGPVDRTRWGELEEIYESESEEEADQGEEEDEKEQRTSRTGQESDTQYVASAGDVFIDSLEAKSVPLKNSQVQQVANENDDRYPKKLYTVLKEKKGGQHESIYGSETLAYDLKRTGDEESVPPSKRRKELHNREKKEEKFRF
ncbi:hypothetical protein KL938_000962 [Ogataea parapolymorpha]|nr:hypothetical protein KL938_000962 [Ogataea parapolymorpha]